MSEKKIQVKKMFDNIAGRYDFLNHFLSFGLDFYWRKKALKLTGLNSNSILLDVKSGKTVKQEKEDTYDVVKASTDKDEIVKSEVVCMRPAKGG